MQEQYFIRWDVRNPRNHFQFPQKNIKTGKVFLAFVIWAVYNPSVLRGRVCKGIVLCPCRTGAHTRGGMEHHNDRHHPS